MKSPLACEMNESLDAVELKATCRGTRISVGELKVQRLLREALVMKCGRDNSLSC